VRHNPELRILHSRPERLIPFRTGQYLAIGLEERERIVERPCSVASWPGALELEFFLEVVSGGQFEPSPVRGAARQRRLPLSRGRIFLPASIGLFGETCAFQNALQDTNHCGIAAQVGGGLAGFEVKRIQWRAQIYSRPLLGPRLILPDAGVETAAFQRPLAGWTAKSYFRKHWSNVGVPQTKPSHGLADRGDQQDPDNDSQGIPSSLHCSQ
jgi:hypothetical protein